MDDNVWGYFCASVKGSTQTEINVKKQTNRKKEKIVCKKDKAVHKRKWSRGKIYIIRLVLGLERRLCKRDKMRVDVGNQFAMKRN